MSDAIREEVSHNVGVDFRDERIVGHVLRDHALGPGLKTALHVELALQPPDHRLRKRDVAFENAAGGCHYIVIRHGSPCMSSFILSDAGSATWRQSKRPGDCLQAFIIENT